MFNVLTKMKKCIKTLLEIIIRIFSNVYSYDFNQKLKQKWNVIYTLWFINFIGKTGKNIFIHYPCRLWGGGGRYINIGDNTTIQANCILGCWIKYAGVNYTPCISIGNNCNIGEHTHITSINGITIGDGLLTGRYVYIGDNSHGNLSLNEASIPPIKRKLQSKGKIKIGNNVWIGDKVTILAGVTIGDNAIIGANSVVTHNVPRNSIVAGIPAKILKTL